MGAGETFPLELALRRNVPAAISGSTGTGPLPPTAVCSRAWDRDLGGGWSEGSLSALGNAHGLGEADNVQRFLATGIKLSFLVENSLCDARGLKHFSRPSTNLLSRVQ